MRKRGLSESVVWAHNPRPDDDNATVLLMAGLESLPVGSKSPFLLAWQYSGGEEREDLRLEPGAFHALRISESVEIEREMREQGLVLVNDPQNEDEVLAKTEQGLRAAFAFWRERGTPKLIAYRQRHGISDHELEARRYELWAYHVASAKAQLIEARLKEVTAERAQRIREAGKAKGAALESKENQRAARMETSATAA